MSLAVTTTFVLFNMMLPWRSRSALPAIGSTVENAVRWFAKQGADSPVTTSLGRTVTNDKTPASRNGSDRTASPGPGKSIYQPLWADQSKAGVSAATVTTPSALRVYVRRTKVLASMVRVWAKGGAPATERRSQMPYTRCVTPTLGKSASPNAFPVPKLTISPPWPICMSCGALVSGRPALYRGQVRPSLLALRGPKNADPSWGSTCHMLGLVRCCKLNFQILPLRSPA